MHYKHINTHTHTHKHTHTHTHDFPAGIWCTVRTLMFSVELHHDFPACALLSAVLADSAECQRMGSYGWATMGWQHPCFLSHTTQQTTVLPRIWSNGWRLKPWSTLSSPPSQMWLVFYDNNNINGNFCSPYLTKMVSTMCFTRSAKMQTLKPQK